VLPAQMDSATTLRFAQNDGEGMSIGGSPEKHRFILSYCVWHSQIAVSRQALSAQMDLSDRATLFAE
jgi:hypothetical protein